MAGDRMSRRDQIRDILARNPVQTLLALDPGLDATGWALFQPPGQRLATLQGYTPCLLASGVVVTKPDSRPDRIQVPARADAVVAGVHADVGRILGPGDVVVIETPAIYGPYASRGPDRGAKALGMARSMAVLWYLIGRLEGFFDLAEIHLIPAAGRKQDHHQLVRSLWPQLPKTKTGPAEDHRDAVWLGLRYMMDGRR
jgi:hypothetical protein